MSELPGEKPGVATRWPAASPPMTVTELVARRGDLKGELLDFAQHARFGRQLTTLMRAAADLGPLDEGILVRTLDHFVLENRLRDGGTVVERFVAQQRPRLTEDESQMLLGWRDVVEGYFEVHPAGDGIGTTVFHNLVDDLRYRVHSNIGPDVFATVRPKMFVYGRIVPVHPATGHWLISGHRGFLSGLRRPDPGPGRMEVVAADPGLLRRNRDLYERAWQLQADDRAAFVDLFGSDLVILPPTTAPARLIEHYRRRLAQVGASVEADGTPTHPAAPGALTAEEMGRLPEDYLDADTVGLIYDETERLNYYRDFGRLDAMFADPALAGDHTHITVLRGYLDDDTVSALPLRRLAGRHPAASTVLRVLLRRPGFSRQRDGEDLLRTRKGAFFGQPAAPRFTVTGDRLAELLYTPSSEEGTVASGDPGSMGRSVIGVTD
ncbi:hypothetical protein [Rhodococcus opacus]|uniref:hypothetical protein n=1 Tax=Rhodococcus opacus TaxID=37919 RepID=UPI001ED9651B|nr:hypothetical protein [Rhodococcus opacus]